MVLGAPSQCDVMEGISVNLFVTVSFRMTKIEREGILHWKGIETTFLIHLPVMPPILHWGMKH